MRKDMGVGLRTWVLCAAAAGLFSQSVPAAAQNKPVATSGADKPKVKPTPTQSTQPPQLLMVSDGTSSSANSVVPASQIELAQNDKSEVQRQLELLYEKDGKEMPDMQLKLVPLNPPGKTPAAAPQAAPASAPRPTTQPVPPSAQKPAKPTPGYTKYQPIPPVRPQTTNYPSPVTPVTTQTTKNYASAFDAQSAQQQQPQAPVQPQTQTQAQAQPRQNPVAGFFKKLIPGARKPLTSQPPIPPDYANAVPDVPPASQAMQSNHYAASPPKGPLPPVTNNMATASKPVLLPAPLNAEPIPLSPVAPKNPIAVGYSSNSIDLPQPDAGLPALAQQPMSLPNNPGEAFMPPLKSETQPLPVVALNTKPQELVYELPKLQAPNDFPNPFPDLPEPQADLKGKALPNVGQVPVVSAPALPAPTLPTPTVQVPTVQVPKADIVIPKEPETSIATLDLPKLDENPFAVRVKDFAEPRIDEQVEANTPSVALTPSSPDVIAPPGPNAPPSPTDTEPDVGPELDVGALSQQPADALTPADPSDSYLEKMQRIRDRFGMKGLKGFCPVTLRDQRELLDARPEFHFTHRSQKFHFASEEARNRFEAEPSLYAPAAYGADVVSLGRDKDVVEGTLDFAAWYKGRLYLFSTQENYEVFVKSPVTYASPAGIE